MKVKVISAKAILLDGVRVSPGCTGDVKNPERVAWLKNNRFVEVIGESKPEPKVKEPEPEPESEPEALDEPMTKPKKKRNYGGN